MPLDRHEKNLRELIMPNGSLLIGAANESFLRSHSVRFVFADECGIYKEGMLPLMKARCTQYYNHKIMLCSTPMNEEDIPQEAFGDDRPNPNGLPLSSSISVGARSKNAYLLFYEKASLDMRGVDAVTGEVVDPL